jgi:hypothetical protein
MTQTIMLLLTLISTACGASELSTATAATNTIGQVLAAVDQVLGEQQRLTRAQADRLYPDDNVAYARLLEPDNARADALDAVWREQGLLHVALSIWAGGGDSASPALWRQAAACTSQTLVRLRQALEPRWRSELAVVMALLDSASRGSDGGAAVSCTSQPPPSAPVSAPEPAQVPL